MRICKIFRDVRITIHNIATDDCRSLYYGIMSVQCFMCVAEWPIHRKVYPANGFRLHRTKDSRLSTRNIISVGKKYGLHGKTRDNCA